MKITSSRPVLLSFIYCKVLVVGRTGKCHVLELNAQYLYTTDNNDRNHVGSTLFAIIVFYDFISTVRSQKSELL